MIVRQLSLVLLTLSTCVAPAERWSEAAPPNGQQQVASILVERCMTCHGPNKQEGGYRVDSFARLRLAGDSGAPAIVSSLPLQSELFKRLTTKDEDARMPSDAAPLTADQVALFEKWIADGAQVDPTDETRPITAWALPVKRIEVPVHYPTSLPITAVAIASSQAANSVWTSGYGEALTWALSESEPRLTGRVPTAGAHVSAIDVSTDGKRLAVASGTPGTQGFVEVFALSDGKSELTWAHACQDLPADLAWSPDSAQLAVGNSDGTLMVAALPSEKNDSVSKRILSPHADAILAVGWSAKGDRLITGSRDRTAKIFDTGNWQLIANYDRHERAVGGVAYLDRYPVSLDETGKLRLWSGDDSDRTLAERDNQARFLEHVIQDGKRIWFAMGADLRSLEVERKTVEDGQDDQGKPKQKTSTRWKTSDDLASGSAAWLLSLDADSKTVIAGSETGEVIVWRAGEKQPWQRFMAKP